MRTKICLLVGMLALVISPGASVSQYPASGNRPGRDSAGRVQDGSNLDSGALRARGNPDRDNARAEERFRALDRNGDGVLSWGEMPRALRSELDKWDKNKDGFLDLNEYKAYFQARHQQSRAEWAAFSPEPPPQRTAPTEATAPVERETGKLVVYRAGKLPKELPPWFEQLDTDHDGQIGLYEWKTSGRPISEFLAMDRNHDGFLTVNEVLKAMAASSQAGAPATRMPGGMGGELPRPRLAQGNSR